jgi:hypothetical protein
MRCGEDHSPAKAAIEQKLGRKVFHRGADYNLLPTSEVIP